MNNERQNFETPTKKTEPFGFFFGGSMCWTVHLLPPEAAAEADCSRSRSLASRQTSWEMAPGSTRTWHSEDFDRDCQASPLDSLDITGRFPAKGARLLGSGRRPAPTDPHAAGPTLLSRPRHSAPRGPPRLCHARRTWQTSCGRHVTCPSDLTP